MTSPRLLKSDDSSASLEWTLNDDSPAVAAAATSDPTPTSDPGAQAVGKVKRKAPTPPKQKTLAVRFAITSGLFAIDGYNMHTHFTCTLFYNLWVVVMLIGYSYFT